MKRRTFLTVGAGTVGGLCIQPASLVLGKEAKAKKKNQKGKSGKKRPFKISLAQWSWHKRLRGQEEPKMDNLDFAKEAKGLGIKAV